MYFNIYLYCQVIVAVQFLLPFLNMCCSIDTKHNDNNALWIDLC